MTGCPCGIVVGVNLNGKTLGREEILHQQRIVAPAIALEPYLSQPIAITGPESLR